jgi:hypothetical protein
MLYPKPRLLPASHLPSISSPRPPPHLQCPNSMRPNTNTDFDNEILLYVFNQQKNNNKLPRGYNCQIVPGSLQTSDTSSCITSCGGNSQNQGWSPNNNNCNNNQGWNPDGGQNQGFNPNGNQQGFNQWPKTALVNGVVSYTCQTSGNQGFSPQSQFSIAYQTRVVYSLTPDCQNDCQNSQGFSNGATVC